MRLLRLRRKEQAIPRYEVTRQTEEYIHVEARNEEDAEEMAIDNEQNWSVSNISYDTYEVDKENYPINT